MGLSSTGKKLLAYAFIVALDIVALALAVSVNAFQEFFFAADLFPLALSIATLAILLVQIALGLRSKSAYTTRPVFEILLLGALTIIWLASNSFTTSRYMGLPNCSVFAGDLAEERAWCRNAQGLRAIIWIEWAALLVTTLALARATITRARRNNTAIWHTTLSRYRSTKHSQDFIQEVSSFYRSSSIFGFDWVTGHQKDASSRDWFAPEPVIRLSSRTDSQEDSSAGETPSGAGQAGLGAYGSESQSAIPLQQQFQTSSASKGPVVTQAVGGFEIVSTGYYFQNEDRWDQRNRQYRT